MLFDALSPVTLNLTHRMVSRKGFMSDRLIGEGGFPTPLPGTVER